MEIQGAHISGIGVIGPFGAGVEAMISAVRSGASCLPELDLFDIPEMEHPRAGVFSGPLPEPRFPRTHRLAIAAALQATRHIHEPPDAVVIGVTTGGMGDSEELIKNGVHDLEKFRYHGIGTVGACVADAVGCSGPVISISTACASGATAIAVALEMIRSGNAHRILAGGVDALCRLTFHGFRCLKLITPDSPRPFDRHRDGMVLSEAAAMLVLENDAVSKVSPIATIIGAGLSCDAYHPATPHPDGEGAALAMRAAIEDAGISPDEIDYISLHGTGTVENDRSEAAAIRTLFPEKPPLLSSVKGAFGHSLAAAGALEAAMSAICIREGLVPGNTGFSVADPAIHLIPVEKPKPGEVRTILSNSFGFGGNNASIVISRSKTTREKPSETIPYPEMTVIDSSCITGAGNMDRTLRALRETGSAHGTSPVEQIIGNLPKKQIRRLRRLSRMVLALAENACRNAGEGQIPKAVYYGSGWGGLTETYDFLSQLFESGERFSSPTDFIGSVHNSPAGHTANHFGSTGPNIAVSSGDISFDQALFCSTLLTRKENYPSLVIAADEYHPFFSDILDDSVRRFKKKSDGGAALLLTREKGKTGVRVSCTLGKGTISDPESLETVLEKNNFPNFYKYGIGAILFGTPRSIRDRAGEALKEYLQRSGLECPVIDYRRFLGEFQAASGVATVLSVRFVQDGKIPAIAGQSEPISLFGKGILLLNAGTNGFSSILVRA